MTPGSCVAACAYSYGYGQNQVRLHDNSPFFFWNFCLECGFLGGFIAQTYIAMWDLDQLLLDGDIRQEILQKKQLGLLWWRLS